MSQLLIGFLIDSLEGGGAEKFTLKIAKLLESENIKTVIFILNDNQDHKASPNQEIKLIKVKKRKLIPNQIHCLQTAWSLDNEIKQTEKKEGVNFLGIIANGLTSHRIASLSKFPKILFRIYSDLPFRIKEISQNKILKEIWLRWRMRNYFNGHHLICVSNQCKNSLVNNLKVKPSHIETIYNPYNFSYIRKRSEEETIKCLPKKYIVCCARFSKVKGHKYLFEAYRKKNIQIPLVLICKSNDLLIQEIKKYNLEKKIIITGFRENPYPIIKNAFISILPSLSEGLPNVVIESLICGTPVIASNVGGVPEIMKGELKKWLVPPEDAQILGEKIMEAISSNISLSDIDLSLFDERAIMHQYLNALNRETKQ